MSGVSTPQRPDEAAWLHRRERAWLPALAVLAVIGFATFGGYVAAGALAQPQGPPVGFPGLVEVQPLSGWEQAPPGTLESRPFVAVTRGNGTLVILDWGIAPGDAGSLARAVVDELLGPSFAQLTVSDRLEGVTLADGTPGSRFTFVGSDPDTGGSVEGEVTTVVDPSGRGVVFIGLAPEGLLAFIDGDLHTMVEQARVGP